jgi:hypothetical protein
VARLGVAAEPAARRGCSFRCRRGELFVEPGVHSKILHLGFDTADLKDAIALLDELQAKS